MKRIYLDYASLTPIDPRVLRAMNKYSSSEYANPSSWYKEGVVAKKAMDSARKSVADFLHAHTDEIIFTSGGTEANSLALEGCGSAFLNAQKVKPHLIISEIEHSSIQETANVLAKQGVAVTRIGVDKNGLIILDELKKAIKPNTFLISIMAVNNETGVIQPIRDIAKIVRQARAKFGDGVAGGVSYPLFHTDASQAVPYQDLNVQSLGVDLMTLDGSKVYGPRGIGALWIKRSLIEHDESMIQPIIYGGGQEKRLRSGTENLPSIIGFAEALKVAEIERTKEVKRISELRNLFIKGLKEIRNDIIVNGISNISPHILNISIPDIDNEFLLFQLDASGVACSTKSSCLRDEDESYVLKAMGADSKTSLRFSFGRWTKRGELVRVLKVIKRLLLQV